MNDKTSKTGSGKKPTLGAYIDALAGVIGHQVPGNLFQGTVLAEAMDKDPAQWSRMRNGRAPVAPLDLLKLLRIFGLERIVDYRIFDSSDIDHFLDSLKEHGIGIYGASSRTRLLGLLAGIAQSSRASIAIEIVSSPTVRAGGIGAPEADDPAIPVVTQGARVRIACTGPAKRHLLLLQHSGGETVEFLMPSRLAPSTEAPKALTIVPTPASDLTTCQVRMEPGFYRLYAVWVDSTIAARASLAIDPSLDTTPLNDATATALSRLLEAADAAERRAATLTYRVTGMSA